MHIFKKMVLLLCLVLPISLLAQSSLVGDWKVGVPDETGTMNYAVVSMMANNTYSVDLGMDGQVDWTGVYEVDGSKLIIQDTGSGCDEKGVYSFTVSATELKMTTIKEGCPNRGNPDGPMVMTRL